MASPFFKGSFARLMSLTVSISIKGFSPIKNHQKRFFFVLGRGKEGKKGCRGI
jgi:hypothetical protein